MASLEARAAVLAQNARDADLHSGKGAKMGDKESKFRGNWNYASRTPTFNAFQFLPTPPPQKPRTRPAEPEVAAPEVAAPEAAPAVDVEACEEAVAALDVGELLDAPPADADVLCMIRDRDSNYRGYIGTVDGECRNNRNVLLGFINAESGACGTADEEYLGAISEESAGRRRSRTIPPTRPNNAQAFNDADCVIEDALDEKCGTLDMGTGYIRDATGEVVAELGPSGVCTGHAGTYLGEFEGYSYHHMKTVALYLMLIDPGMLNEVEG